MVSMTFRKVNEYLTGGTRYLSAMFIAPSRAQQQTGLFIFGVLILATGLMSGAHAQFFGDVSVFAGGGGSAASSAPGTALGNYNDVRIAEAVNRIFAYLEGPFGALVMVAAGLGAILASAFGQYRAALGLLVVAVGAFILRSLVSTFFNDVSIA